MTDDDDINEDLYGAFPTYRSRESSYTAVSKTKD